MNKSKDRKSNKKTILLALGARNNTDPDREEHDYYATDPKAADLLCDVESFSGSIWENACGEGHLSKRLKERGYKVISTDLIDRGYGKGGIDFFKTTSPMADNIVTNPPYTYAKEWVEHSISILNEGRKVALFLPLLFLEGKNKESFFEKYPPKTIYVCRGRILCGKNGDFRAKDKDGNVIYDKNGIPKRMSSPRCHSWFVWEKGFEGDPIIKWIN